MNNDIKNTLDNLLENLYLSEDIKQQCLDNVSQDKNRLRPALAAAMCLCLVFVLSVPLLGATFPNFNRLIAQINPYIADFLIPVEYNYTDNGIKMEVIGAMRDGDTAIIYVSIQDLEGDRLDESIMLEEFDVQGLHMLTQEVVGYDRDNKTVTVKVTVTGDLGNEDLALTANTITSINKSTRIFDTKINLSSLAFSTNTASLDLTKQHTANYSDPSLFDQFIQAGNMNILAIGEKHIAIPGVEYAYISNIGFVDGLLHIQIHYPESNESGTANGQLWLTDAPIDTINLGEVYLYNEYNILNDTSFQFSAEEDGSVYCESVYDITESELSGYKLLGVGFGDYGTISGNWEIAFAIESQPQAKVSCNISEAGCNITDVIFSPFQISLIGQGNITQDGQIDIVITMKNGDVRHYGAVIKYIDENNLEFNIINSDDNPQYDKTTASLGFGADNSVELRFIPDVPLEADKIEAITLNGEPIK